MVRVYGVMDFEDQISDRCCIWLAGTDPRATLNTPASLKQIGLWLCLVWLMNRNVTAVSRSVAGL